ncbi:MAG: thiamine pyrophosphate-binding protein, partial [Pseudomonadota bacterium]
MRHGGKILIECLQNLGARHAFGVPGESYLAALDALHDTGGALDFTLCRNEGGAAFMAAAYGKLTGTPGICFVTRGPGATNASIGVHTAMQDSSPMILFVGQVGTDMMGREAFQEIDYRAFYGTVAKGVTQVDHIERLPEAISRAWTTALSGRPGPVVVALPEDMLSAQSDVPAITRPVHIARPAPDTRALAEAQQMIAAAERPLIIMGGGSWTKDGSAALQHFAEASDIPVLAGFRYMDLYDNFSPAYAGDAGVGMNPATKELITSADLTVAIGIRFGEMVADGYTLMQVPEPAQHLIHVHSSDRELGKVYAPDIAIHADPNAFAAALNPVSGAWSDWRAEARAGHEASLIAPPQPSAVDMGQVMTHLQSTLPDDTIITNGAGNFAIWPSRFFSYGPRNRLLAPQSGAMGYGLPAAIAAKV